MLTSIPRATHWHFRSLQIALALLLAACTPARAQTATKAGDLYLLAGTQTVGFTAGYPVTLYTVDPARKLKRARVIVPADQAPPFWGTGLFSVQDDMADHLYVAYPHENPTTLSIIHKGRPMETDRVEFNPKGMTVGHTNWCLTPASAGQSYQLGTLLPSWGVVYPICVAGNASKQEPRIRQGDWSLFNSLLYQGAAPGVGIVPLGFIADNHVCLQTEPGIGPFTMRTYLDSIPPFPLKDPTNLLEIPPDPLKRPRNILYIVAASPRYFAFAFLPGHSSLYVHDRKLNTWKELSSISTIPYFRRIFGSWLATLVEIRERPHEEDPGIENERDWQNAFLPNVRLLNSMDRIENFIPGTLLLDNLEDGRRITIQTSQEDSEILTVRDDGLVLYRVNDSIFAAQIVGEKLTKPSLVVKDADVPEVHWVFWSH
jgi:hypothetical protein